MLKMVMCYISGSLFLLPVIKYETNEIKSKRVESDIHIRSLIDRPSFILENCLYFAFNSAKHQESSDK